MSVLLAHRPGFVAPTVAARKLATLDQFSGGRVAVHVISGGSDADQRRDGDYLDHDDRYRRTDEYLDILEAIWTATGPLDHEGRFYRFEGAWSDVRCVQQPHLPIYFGGSSDIAVEIAARHADVYALWGEPLADARAHIHRVRTAAQGHGREIGISLSTRPILAATEEAAWARAYEILDSIQRRVAGGGLAVRDLVPSGSRRLIEAARQGDVLDERLFMPLATATGAAGNSTALVGTPEQVAAAMLAYIDIGVTTLLIRGYDPYRDAQELWRADQPGAGRGRASGDRGVGRLMAPIFITMAPSSGDTEFPGSGAAAAGNWTAGADREPTLEYLTRIAEVAEAVGFSTLLLPVGTGCLDGWVAAAALAARTTGGLRFMVAVRPGFVQPAVAAREAATFDDLSGGRLDLNVVTGGAPPELARDGDFLPDDERYRRTEEFVGVLRRLLQGERVNHEGPFFRLQDAFVYPTPVQLPSHRSSSRRRVGIRAESGRARGRRLHDLGRALGRPRALAERGWGAGGGGGPATGPLGEFPGHPGRDRGRSLAVERKRCWSAWLGRRSLRTERTVARVDSSGQQRLAAYVELSERQRFRIGPNLSGWADAGSQRQQQCARRHARPGGGSVDRGVRDGVRPRPPAGSRTSR